MKKIMILVMSFVLAIGLTACGSIIGDINLEAGQSAIYIHKDGIVSYAVAESFDKDYYDEDDLKSKIKSEVEDYNASDEASVNDAVELDDFDVSKGVATVVIEFATDYDFLGYIKSYNRVEADRFYIGTIADNSKCKIKGDFVSSDGKENIKGKEISKMTEAYILIVNEEYKVQIDGKVLYTGTNCKIDDDGIITTAKADDGMSYIVYTLGE